MPSARNLFPRKALLLRELQEQLAEQAAANHGRKAIINALVAACERLTRATQDQNRGWPRDILTGNGERRVRWPCFDMPRKSIDKMQMICSQ